MIAAALAGPIVSRRSIGYARALHRAAVEPQAQRVAEAADRVRDRLASIYAQPDPLQAQREAAPWLSLLYRLTL